MAAGTGRSGASWSPWAASSSARWCRRSSSGKARSGAYAFVAAAVIAPARLAYQGVLFQTMGRSLALLVNPLRKPEDRKPVPKELETWFRMGPAIFLGAAVTTLLHWGR
jgi:hypothetical protein